MRLGLTDGPGWCVGGQGVRVVCVWVGGGWGGCSTVDMHYGNRRGGGPWGRGAN